MHEMFINSYSIMKILILTGLEVVLPSTC